MDFRLKKHRKQYFIVISYATSRNYCAPAPHVHGQEIFKTLFQIPNHEQRQAALEHLKAGASISAVAREFGTSRQTIMRLRDDAVSPELPE